MIDTSGFKTWRNEHVVAHMLKNSAVDSLGCVPYVSCTMESEGMYFELLPTEILNVIVGNLVGEDVLQLSCTSQQLRAICSPRLFRKVRFPLSIRGLDNLRQFLECDASQHVVSLTYVILYQSYFLLVSLYDDNYIASLLMYVEKSRTLISLRSIFLLLNITSTCQGIYTRMRL